MYTGGFSPEKLDYITQQHYWRYLFASDFVNERKVLDIACGVGYGSYHLRKVGASQVVSVDLADDALGYYRKHYLGRGLACSYGDARKLPFSDCTFDVVVSFETIEHLVESELYISEMKRVLKDDGLFICSTPNTKYTHYNPSHVREFQCSEFFDFLNYNFGNVTRYGQHFYMKDRIGGFPLALRKRLLTGPLRKLLSKMQLGNGVIQKYYQQEKVKREGRRYEIDKNLLNPFYAVEQLEENPKGLLRIMIGVCQKNEKHFVLEKL